ncbi:hypothetical protein EE612_057111, partial [Oryza sativa]
INFNGALHRNFLVIICSSLVNLAEATLSNYGTVIFCDFLQLLLCEHPNA